MTEKAYEIPRWTAIVLALVLLGTVAVCAWSFMPRSASGGATMPTPVANGEVKDKTVTGKQLSSHSIVALLSDGDTLWAGSDVHGLFTLAGDELTPAYPDVQVFSLLPDGEGLWVGYVDFAGQAPVASVQGEAGLSLTFDAPVFMPGPGDAGLARWDGEAWTSVWASNHGVWSVANANSGGLYLSTNDGVYLLKGRRSHRLGLKDTLCFGLLHDDGRKVLYAGTLGGIWRYTGGRWTHVLNLPDHKALALARAGDGTLYAATTTGLYASTDGETWRLKAGAGLALEAVVVSPEGRIFAGGEQGLYEVTGDGVKVLVEFPTVHTLAWHQDHLYAGSEGGLWRITWKEDFLQ